MRRNADPPKTTVESMDLHGLLKQKARPVHTISSTHSVEDAVAVMTSQNVRALIVTEDESPLSVFSRSDVLRAYMKEGTAGFATTRLKQVLTHRLITAQSRDGVGPAMAMMMKAGIRHLPVLEEERLIGLLTLDDLMEYQIETLMAEIGQLREYIADLHAAGHD